MHCSWQSWKAQTSGGVQSELTAQAAETSTPWRSEHAAAVTARGAKRARAKRSGVRRERRGLRWRWTCMPARGG
jgi:hypothetical protein